MGGTARARLAPLVLGVVFLATLAAAPHEHRGYGPALHDDACSLAQLGAGIPAIGLPSAVDLVAPHAAVGMALLPAPPGAGGAAPLGTAPRGPPAAV